jgi:hypothetical protein
MKSTQIFQTTTHQTANARGTWDRYRVETYRQQRFAAAQGRDTRRISLVESSSFLKMPPKKKVARNNNKKKKGSIGTGNTGAAAASQGSFHPWRDPATPSKALKEGGLYATYKNATERFKVGLQALLRSSDSTEVRLILTSSDAPVHALVNAVDAIAEKAEGDSVVIVPRQLLADLMLAIRIRARVAKTFGDEDSGHTYFISVLAYCWAVLKPLAVAATSQKQKSASEEETDQAGNRFEALSVEDDDFEDEDMVSIVKEHGQRPAEPPTAYSLVQDLICGDDRFQARVFLEALDELMRYSVEQYRKLKLAWREGAVAGHPPTIYIEHLMECTVNSNFAMQQVMHLEQQLAAENPHLSTIYRVFAAVVFPALVGTLHAEIIRLNATADRNELKHAITDFIGDATEYAFRNKSDPSNRLNDLVTDFAEKWMVDRALVAQHAEMVRIAVCLETPFRPQEIANQEIYKRHPELDSDIISKHQWLKHLPHIGGTRSIVSTQRLVQCLSSVHNPNTRLELKRGFFGRQWDEKSKKAVQIPGDLDEFLMGDVMPHLFAICTWGLASNKLPRENELLPLFVMIKSFLKSPNQPCPVALTFGVHTLLTAVFEMQGNDDMHQLAVTSKVCGRRVHGTSLTSPFDSNFYHVFDFLLAMLRPVHGST